MIIGVLGGLDATLSHLTTPTGGNSGGQGIISNQTCPTCYDDPNHNQAAALDDGQ